MINAHLNRDATVPWWAVLGAPLLGVPLLVALLAIGAPRDAEVEVVREPEAASYVGEPVEWTPSDATVDVPAGHPDRVSPSRG